LDKKIANSSKQARQLITHKKILVDGQVVSVPSYVVSVELEDKILLRKPKIKEPKNVEEEK
jgi:small subunit ribosomal protein S4